ncbi:MAG TPA: hypothetical protein DEB09_01755 [Candidatus Magasanikbacteria bacterium]|nr:hypothetical protein [Candidatus Magasanikbacteria bacterium]
MQNERCARVVPRQDGKNKKCAHGSEIGCKECHRAHPEILKKIDPKYKNEPPIMRESDPFED